MYSGSYVPLWVAVVVRCRYVSDSQWPCYVTSEVMRDGWMMDLPIANENVWFIFNALVVIIEIAFWKGKVKHWKQNKTRDWRYNLYCIVAWRAWRDRSNRIQTCDARAHRHMAQTRRRQTHSSGTAHGCDFRHQGKLNFRPSDTRRRLQWHKIVLYYPFRIQRDMRARMKHCFLARAPALLREMCAWYQAYINKEKTKRRLVRGAAYNAPLGWRGIKSCCRTYSRARFKQLECRVYLKLILKQ